VKTVYRNVEDVYPLSIKEWQASLSGGAGASSMPGLGKIASQLKAGYATKVKGLLFEIDEHTKAIMINFRGVYLAFQTDPCSNQAFFLRHVEKIVSEEQQISRWQVQVRALIELARSRPDDVEQFLAVFKEIAGSVGGAPAVEAASIEIAEARQLADGWSKQ
jgi:hypothetical protein